jgi:hypothetical protein
MIQGPIGRGGGVTTPNYPLVHVTNWVDEYYTRKTKYYYLAYIPVLNSVARSMDT